MELQTGNSARYAEKIKDVGVTEQLSFRTQTSGSRDQLTVEIYTSASR
jgi:hypothetical protein